MRQQGARELTHGLSKYQAMRCVGNGMAIVVIIGIVDRVEQVDSSGSIRNRPCAASISVVWRANCGA